MRAKLAEVKKELRKRMYQLIPDQGTLTGASRQRLLRLSRGSHEPRDDRSVRSLRGTVIVSHASAPQPESPVHMGTGASPRCRLAPSSPKLPPLATRAFRRQTLEVKTGCTTARNCGVSWSSARHWFLRRLPPRGHPLLPLR